MCPRDKSAVNLYKNLWINSIRLIQCALEPSRRSSFDIELPLNYWRSFKEIKELKKHNVIRPLLKEHIFSFKGIKVFKRPSILSSSLSRCQKRKYFCLNLLHKFIQGIIFRCHFWHQLVDERVFLRSFYLYSFH